MKQFLSISLFFVASIFYAQNNPLVGKWKTIDDETGVEKAVVSIYEKSGKIYGKVVSILEEEHKNDVCVNCTGADKNKPVIDMIIIKGLSKEDNNEYGSGQILDPKTGKLYKCHMTLENKDVLKVRGYIGFSIIGRTQYWYRVK